MINWEKSHYHPHNFATIYDCKPAMRMHARPSALEPVWPSSKKHTLRPNNTCKNGWTDTTHTLPATTAEATAGRAQRTRYPPKPRKRPEHSGNKTRRLRRPTCNLGQCI
eukprot:UN3370